MEARVEKPHRIAGYCRISVDVEADRDNRGSKMLVFSLCKSCFIARV